MNGVDVLRDFDFVSSDLDAHETSEVPNEADWDSVWLECDGELVDAGSVKLLQFTSPPAASRPCCSFARGATSPHESLRFR